MRDQYNVPDERHPELPTIPVGVFVEVGVVLTSLECNCQDGENDGHEKDDKDHPEEVFDELFGYARLAQSGPLELQRRETVRADIDHDANDVLDISHYASLDD